MKHFVLTFLMLLSFSIAAYGFEYIEFDVGGIWYRSISDTKVEVFDYKKGITHANIPSTVTYENDEDDEDVEDVEDWSGDTKTFRVVSIGILAFRNCTSLSSVTIPSSVTTIGDGAFGNCTSLSSVTIPSSVTYIGTAAFYGCTSLTNVRIKDSNEELEMNTYVFNKCPIQKLYVGRDLEIWDFETELKEVTISEYVTTIGYSAFDDCTSLSSITIPPSVTTIGERAFCGCTSLSSITIPPSVTTIGERAFRGCTALSSVTIEKGVQRIERYAFTNTGLKEITFPASLKELSHDFFSWSQTIAITCLAEIPPVIYDADEYFTGFYCNYLLVPSGSEERYRKDGWLDFRYAKNCVIWPMYSTIGYADYTEDEDGMRSVGGVTADGMSKIVMQKPLDFSTFDNENKPFLGDYEEEHEDAAECFTHYLSLQTPKVHFLVEGKRVTDSKLTGTIKSTKDGFVYTAPEDFIVNDEQPNLNYYDLTMEFCIDESTDLALVNQYRTTIRVFRPGLVLLHGLNSDRSCFEMLEETLLMSDYNSNGEYENEGRLINMDYNETNQADFATNAKRLGDTLLEMYNNLAEMGIVSSRYDVVGHSMGGLIARTYVQTIKPDGINRIITLNTPHGGSPWAGTLTKAVNDVAQPFTKIAEILKDAVTFDFSKLVDDLTIYKNTSAWYDLSTKSDAIKNLNNNYTVTSAYPPVYAFCSSMTPPESKSSEDKSWWTVVKEKLSVAVLKLLNPTETFVNFVMEDESDGIVPLYSQTGGLTLDNMTIAYAPFKGPMGFGLDAHHTKTHHWPLMLDIMIQAIRTEKSSKYFCKSYFKPIKMQEPKQYVRSNVGEMVVEAAPEGSFVKINAGFGQTDSVRVADVVLKKSDDIECTMVYAKLDDERYYVEVDEDTLHFAIPNDYHGNLTFLALGKVKDMNALVADEATLTFINDSELQSIYFVDGEQMSIVVGQAVEPVVTAVYDYGEDEGFKAALSTDSPDLLAIEGNKVRGLAEGLCTLTAESGVEGISATIGVRIVPDPSGINSLAASNSGISVYTRGNELVVDFLNDYDGVFDITIYDASGQQCMARRNFTDRKVGDAYTLDISSLPHGKVYVVSIRMKQGTVGYKIFVD